MVDKLAVLETLKRCDVFLGLGDSELRQIIDLSSCQEKLYLPGELIFRAGEESRHFYVVQDGAVNLLVSRTTSSPPGKLETAVLRNISRGATFGWSSLVPPHVRVFSATPKGPARVIVMSGEQLLALFSQNPRIGYEVMNSLLRVVVSRVRDIEQLLLTGKSSPLFDRPPTLLD